MPGAIRIPATVGDITIDADLRAQQIVASVSVPAPKTGRPATKINWLLRQLKSSSPNVRLDCWGKRARTSMADMLGNVRNKPEILIPLDNREISSFTVSLLQPMGVKRGVGKNAFIDSFLQALDDFYGDVVQHLREWQPAAPRLPKGVAEPQEEVAKTAEDAPDLTIGSTKAEDQPVPDSGVEKGSGESFQH